MKTPLFSYPSYQYQIDDWNFKKKSLLNRINSQKFIRTPLQTFESDRSTNQKSYVRYLAELLSPELTEAQVESRSFYKWDEENLEWVLETPAPE